MESIVTKVLDFEDCVCDEVSLFFVETEEICQLHEQYFHDPSPTDCISFPMDKEAVGGTFVLGEVFVCPETAIKYVEEKGGDASQEMILYVIHGLLHLLGYDDIDEGDRAQMRLAEQRNMENIKGI